MAHCLNLTRTSEYAIAALARLALETEGSLAKSTTIQALAASQKIPKSFLGKIINLCVKKGLLWAKSGPRGGVRLAKLPKDFTLLEIVEACEGVYAREWCVFYQQRRCEGPACSNYCPLRREEEKVRGLLAGVNLAAMAKSLAVHPEGY